MRKIGIIGCGIAGLALASLLKKSLDFDISIFEKDNIQDTNVSGIQISPNGKKVLSHLNFSNFQKDNFCSIKKISFFDMVSSSRISDMNLNYLKNESYITLNRSELIKFLIHEYSLSKNIIKQKVVSFDEKKIILEDNNQLGFDIIIVADGIFSKLRINNIKPVYSGYSAIRGFYKNLEIEDHIDVCLGKNCHLVKYPIDKKLNKSFTLVKKIELKQDINHYNYPLENFFNDYKDIIPQDHHEIFKTTKTVIWPIYKLNKIFYGHDKSIFIGDSAHGFIPSRAQGASMALEDSMHLFNLINKNLVSADKLSKLRQKRILKVISKSENNLIIFHLSSFVLRNIRNQIIKIICKIHFLTKTINSYIFDYNANKSDF